MSDEQKDAVIGRVTRERGEAKRHLAALKAEAHKLGRILISIGRELEHSPEYVAFEREPINSIYSNPILNKPVYRSQDIDAGQLLKLTNDIRSTMDELKILSDQAANLGIA